MSQIIKNNSLDEVVVAFGFEAQTAEILAISGGLINTTYKVSDAAKSILLQRINSNVFSNPSDIVHNYLQIYEYLKINSDYKIPEPVKTTDGKDFFIDADNFFWRAVQFISGTFTYETANTSKDAFNTAYSFGNFTNMLSGLEVTNLKTIIPRFHDIEFRFKQFTESLAIGSEVRKEKAKVWIDQLLNRKHFVDFYLKIKNDPQYKQRVMHHDAKLSNILIDEKSKEIVCLVDLDTTQSGLFYSDLGDMIRSMACNLPENSIDFDSLKIREDFYKEILNGYLQAMANELTAEEKKNIHYAGLFMVYMQALRFMTDYLNDDIYYKITYPEQNFDRSKNQILLLKKLESFIEKEFHFTV